MGKQYRCSHCEGHFEVPIVANKNERFPCPLCGLETLLISLNTGARAIREKRNRFQWRSVICFVGGTLVMFWFPIGTVLGVPVILYGGHISRYLGCSLCGQEIKDKQAPTCEACHAKFV